MNVSSCKAVPLTAMIVCSTVGCSGVLGYDDLAFSDDGGEWPHWSPADGSVPEITAQDVPPPLNSACMQSSVALVGTLEGAKADGCFSMSWHTIDQSVSPSSMEVEFGTEGKVHMQWTGLLSDGMSTPATGTLKMPAEGASAGKQFCVDTGSFAMFEVGLGERVYTFALSKLSSGATCPGTAVAGSLQGDFRTQ
jgi:hypothetical protein